MRVISIKASQQPLGELKKKSIYSLSTAYIKNVSVFMY